MYVFLFDIDGTLVRSGGAGKAAFEGAMSALFGDPTYDRDVTFTGRTDRAIARDLFGNFGVEDSAENWERFRREYLQRLPTTLLGREGRVLPGIVALLDRLADRSDTLVGLLTGNMQAGARAKLEHFRLWDRFRFGAFGDSHLERDDVARDAVQFAGQHVEGEVNIDRTWVIGDTPRDVACARAVGARAVAVATGTHSREELVDSRPDLLLEDLSDPDPLLEQMR